MSRIYLFGKTKGMNFEMLFKATDVFQTAPFEIYASMYPTIPCARIDYFNKVHDFFLGLGRFMFQFIE